MPDHKEIYKQHADQYERLVSREDYQGNILRALKQIRPLDGLDVVELGAGTGRLTCMLAPVVRSMRAFDASQHMLEVTIAKLEQSGLRNWRVEVADHRDLPVEDQSADIAISGWSVCYMAVEYEETWRAEVSQVLAEMKRALRPGGTIIILETLGTGYERPHAPHNLVAYYAFLEEAGFCSSWIRTDFQFESLEEAKNLIHFFFGEALAEKAVEENWIILPECTGIWWLEV